MIRLLKMSFFKWLDDDCPRMGAALAYYTVFALVPILLLGAAFVGLVMQADKSQDVLVGQLNQLFGRQASSALQKIVQAAQPPRAVGIFVGVLGLITLAFAASGIIVELKTAINKIWGVKAISRNLIMFLKKRLVSATMVLGIGFLFIFATLISTGITALGKYLENGGFTEQLLMQFVNSLVSFGVVTVLIAFLYKLLPDAKVDWHSIVLGALVSSFLFLLGRIFIDIYLSQSGFESVFGAGGSFLILLFWIYYSSQIFYFGAEVAFVHANLLHADA